MEKTEPLTKKTHSSSRHKHRSKHRHKRPLTTQEKIMRKINSFSTLHLVLILLASFVILGGIVLYSAVKNNTQQILSNAASNIQTQVINPGPSTDRSVTKYNIDFSQMKGLSLTMISRGPNDLNLGKPFPKRASLILTYYGQDRVNSLMQFNTSLFPPLNNPNLIVNPNFKGNYRLKEIPVAFTTFKNFNLNCSVVYDDNSLSNLKTSSLITQALMNYNLNLTTANGSENVTIYQTNSTALIYAFSATNRRNYELNCDNANLLLQNIENLYSSLF